MPQSSTEILSPSRTEIARGRPRAALKELELARVALLANADLDGLRELLELARAIHTLAPVDTKARERLLAATEEGIESVAPGASGELTGSSSHTVASTDPRASFSPYALVSTEQIFAPARAEIERQNVGRSLRLLEKARRKLLARGDVDGLGELIELAQRLPIAKPRHVAQRKRLIDAAQQNVRYLGRGKAIRTGEAWSDPFVAAKPKTRLPSLPPMTRREKLIAAAIVVVLAGAITAWALVKRAPQRVAHAITCPTGQQGSPTWSPDGKQIAFAKNGECGTQIMVMPAAGGPLRTVTSRFGELPDWSPDGREILYRSKDGFSVVAVAGGEQRLIRKDDGDMGASWSRDGEWIAFTHGELPPTDFLGGISHPYESTLYVMRRDGRKTTRIIGHACDPGTPSWRPGSGELSFACSGRLSGIYVYRQSDGKLAPFAGVPFDNTAYVPRNVSWSPDGREVAFGRNGVEVASRKTDTSPGDRLPPPIAQVYLPGLATIDVAWSPDGKQIAFSVIDSGSDDGLYVIDSDGSHRRHLVRF